MNDVNCWIPQHIRARTHK